MKLTEKHLVISALSGLGIIIYHLTSNALMAKKKNNEVSFEFEEIPLSVFVWACVLTSLNILPYWRNYPLRRFCLRYLGNTFNGLWTWLIILLNLRNRRQHQQSTRAVLFRRRGNRIVSNNHSNDVELIEL